MYFELCTCDQSFTLVREEKKPKKRKKPTQDFQNFACIGQNFTKVKEGKKPTILQPSCLQNVKVRQTFMPIER
jgi:hypothetical protein